MEIEPMHFKRGGMGFNHRAASKSNERMSSFFSMVCLEIVRLLMISALQRTVTAGER